MNAADSRVAWQWWAAKFRSRLTAFPHLQLPWIAARADLVQGSCQSHRPEAHLLSSHAHDLQPLRCQRNTFGFALAHASKKMYLSLVFSLRP